MCGCVFTYVGSNLSTYAASYLAIVVADLRSGCLATGRPRQQWRCCLSGCRHTRASRHPVHRPRILYAVVYIDRANTQQYVANAAELRSCAADPAGPIFYTDGKPTNGAVGCCVLTCSFGRGLICCIGHQFGWVGVAVVLHGRRQRCAYVVNALVRRTSKRVCGHVCDMWL